MRLELGIQLDRGLDVADRAEGQILEAHRGDHERLATGLACLLRSRVEQRLQQLHIVDVDDPDVGAHQLVEQEVALQHRAFLAVHQDQGDVEAELAGGGGHLPAPVRLAVGAGDQQVAALAEHLGEHELELPGLVAAEAEAGHVVALDPHFCPADRLRQSRRRLQRRRQMGERHARQPIDTGLELGSAAHVTRPSAW